MINENKVLYAKVPVKIRTSPDINSESLGTLHIGDSVEVIEVTPKWIHHTRGWSVRKFFSENVEEIFDKASGQPTLYPYNRQAQANMSLYRVKAKDDGKPAASANPADNKFVDPSIPRGENANKTGETTKLDENGNPIGGDTLSTENVPSIQANIGALLTGDSDSDLDFSTGLRGLWGMPYAFTDITDPIPGAITRNTADGQQWFYGRVFTETFLSDMPVLVITAGVPSFMTQASEDDKKIAMTAIMQNDPAKSEEIAEYNIDGGGIEYFTFKESMAEYYGYVNFMCRGIASFLNLGETNRTMSEKFKRFFLAPFLGNDIVKDPAKVNWQYYPKRKEINQFAGDSYANYIACYVDPNSSGGESMSNSTTQSVLSGINSLSDKSRDMGFMFAHLSGTDAKMFTDDVNEKLTKDFAEDAMKDSNFSKRFNAMVSSSAAVLKNGGKMIFPEIWSDSSYQKSFSISASFHSPYGDPMSIFLHVLVPFVHLFCLAAPRQLGVNGIMSPFLVRAYIKGEFCCSMGIVDSFSFKKGGQGDAWSLDGLPLSIEVDMSVNELYSSMSISRVENLSDALGIAGMNYPLSNTMLLDFMANLTACDLNVNQLERKVKLVLIYIQSKYSDPFRNIPSKIARKVRQTVGSLLRRAGLNNNL